MMFDELSDLDFGTYFNAVSTKQQQQQQNCNSEGFNNGSMPSPPLMNRNNSDISSSSSSVSNYNNSNQQQYYRNSILDWNVDQQQQHHHHSSIHSTPDSSPQSSTSEYTLHPFSPPLHSHQYSNLEDAYNRTKSFSNNNNTSFFVNSPAEARSSYPSNSIFLNGDIPSITIPTTPTAISTPSHIVFSQSEPVFPRLSSLLNDTNLSRINANDDITMKSDDQKEELVHPLDVGNDSADHTTRNWRKATNKIDIPKGLGFLRGVEPEKQLKKVAHNAIERRYRNNINDRIRELKNAVPALYKARINEGKSSSNSPCDGIDSDNEEESDEVIIDGVQVAKKLNKATILRKATEYICFLKNTNDNAVQENMILQQIIAQMPGGPEALDQFLAEKSEFERYETERLARERRETLELERLERKKMLRERAAQRAALAQLLPKQERKPYRRRQSKKQNENSKKRIKADDDQDRNKMLMVGFMCLVFFTSTPGGGDASEKAHHYDFSSSSSSSSSSSYLVNQTTDIPSRSLTDSTRFMSLDLWNTLRICIGIFGLFYICLIPLLVSWLRPRPVKKPVVVVNKEVILPDDEKSSSSYFHAMLTLYSTIRNILLISVTRLTSFTSFEKEDEEAFTLTLVKLNEAQCLKENSNATRLTILQNCVQMLVRLCTTKDPIVKARGYTAAGLQLKLWFNDTMFLSYLTSYCLNKSQEYIGKTNKHQQQQQINSVSIYDQAIDYLSLNSHRHHSSLVVSVTDTATPLQLVVYFQQLEDMKTSWMSLLNSDDETFGSHFNENQLLDVRSKKVDGHLTTQASCLLEWFTLAGIILQDDYTANSDYLNTLVDSTNDTSCFSPSFKSYQKMICHTLEAAQSYKMMESSNDIDQTLFYLDQAFNYIIDANKCISQEKDLLIETDLLMILVLITHSKMLEYLLLATANKNDHNQTLSFYISELKEQVLAISSNSNFNVPGRIQSLTLERF